MAETAALDVSGDSAVSSSASNDEKYLIFSILGKGYALPSRFISEIAVFDAVYPLPLMPDYVLGIINRYSTPYVLFDIGLLLARTPTPQGKMLVLKEEIDRIALLIDDVIDISAIPQAELFETERGVESGDLAELVSASCKWNGEDVFVLDIQRLLSRIANEAPGRGAA